MCAPEIPIFCNDEIKKELPKEINPFEMTLEQSINFRLQQQQKSFENRQKEFNELQKLKKQVKDLKNNG